MSEASTFEHEAELVKVAGEARRHALLPFDVVSDEIPEQSLHSSSRSLLLSFKSNLEDAVQLCSTIYKLCQKAETDLKFQSVHSRERILSLKDSIPHGNLSEEQEKKALELAIEKMAELHANSQSPEYRSLLLRIVRRVVQVCSSEELGPSSRNLTRQSIVLIWNAFEVLSKDAAEQLLNKTPDLISKIMTNDLAKKRFDVRRIALEDLLNAGFDFSDGFGSYFTQKFDISDLSAIRTFWEAASNGNANLQSLLSDQQTYELSQVRNLIVHRRGRVDKAFLDKTSFSQPLGSEVIVTPDYFEKCSRHVWKLGHELVKDFDSLQNRA